MGFTKITENLNIHQSLSDEPNIDDGLSSEELKKKFDEPAEKLKQAFNNLIDELTVKTSASNIGAGPLVESDFSGANVEAKLIYLYNAIQNVVLGQVPDNSITKEKIDETYRDTLAVKNGTVQKNLNSEKLGGKMLNELASYFMVTGSIEVEEIGKIITIELGFTPRAVIVSAGADRLGNLLLTETCIVTSERPTYIYSQSGGIGDRVNLKLIENGFEYMRSRNSGSVNYGTGYRYIAFR